jgi:hypothetical protein
MLSSGLTTERSDQTYRTIIFGTAFDIYYSEEMILLKLKTMKKLIITSALALLVAFGTTVLAQDNPKEYLGLPGDNLNLYAVMKLFQDSQTLEGFEKSLNDENSEINNLDLNNDNMIDYLTVSDNVDGDVHTIVLRDMLGKNESQDIAVFTVQRFNNGSVQIQLIGDEALYGKNYIIEPITDDSNGETPNPGYTGTQVTIIRTTPVEIAAWPLVRFIYLPNYSIWHSSWYWGYYPEYWHPWRPLYWHFYYGYQYNRYNDYYAHYRRWDNYRYPRYNDFYYRGIRAHSPDVDLRIHDGRYKTTYSHPEQRSEGEAYYTKRNPGQDNRRQDNRESNSAINNSRNQRQQENGVTNRSRYNRTPDQNENVSRSRTTPPDRSMNRAEQSQRSVSRPEQTQRNATTRTEQTQRSVTRPQQTQRSESVRQSRQSAPKVSSSTSKREGRTSNSGKSNERTKESKTTKESRRK